MSNAKRRREQQRKQQKSKTVLYGIAAVGALGLLFGAQALFAGGGGAQARAAAPAWEATTLDGEPFSSASLEGDVYVVDFFYTWCPKCAAQYPHKAALVNRFTDRDDFHFFSVNSDPSETRASLDQYISSHGSTWPYIKDEYGLLAKFRADSRPFIVFVDRDGNIAKTLRVITPADKLIEIAEGLLNEPGPAPPAPEATAGNATAGA